MSDFERCSELRDWRRAHAGDLPSRSSDNEYEQSLARWYSKASQRQHRALSSRPSERQLTPDETAHLDSIVRIAIESPAAAPVEPLRKRLRTKSSSVPDSAAPTSKSAGRTQRDRKQRASESSPAASAEQLPQGLPKTARAARLCLKVMQDCAFVFSDEDRTIRSDADVVQLNRTAGYVQDSGDEFFNSDSDSDSDSDGDDSDGSD